MRLGVIVFVDRHPRRALRATANRCRISARLKKELEASQP